MVLIKERWSYSLVLTPLLPERHVNPSLHEDRLAGLPAVILVRYLPPQEAAGFGRRVREGIVRVDFPRKSLIQRSHSSFKSNKNNEKKITNNNYSMSKREKTPLDSD